MKKLFLLQLFTVMVFWSCTPNTPSTVNNNNRYVKINFSGKTLEEDGAFASIMTNNDGIGGVYSNLMIIGTVVSISGVNKVGNAVGNYVTTQIGTVLNGNYVTDNTVGNKHYDIDSGAIFTVTRVDASMIEGTFACNLLDGSTIIPATGSFLLPHN